MFKKQYDGINCPKLNRKSLQATSIIMLCIMVILALQPLHAFWKCAKEDVLLILARSSLASVKVAAAAADEAVENAEGAAELVAALAFQAAMQKLLNEAELDYKDAKDALSACKKGHEPCPCNCGATRNECDGECANWN